MKRSQHIRLILIGVSTGALAGCGQNPAITSDNAYTNNYYVPGVGYYHAPFRAWYPLPYNDFNPGTARYYFGGEWGAWPFQSITNISSPTYDAATLAEQTRTDISRGGFGSYHSGYYGGGGYSGGGYHGGWGGFGG